MLYRLWEDGKVGSLDDPLEKYVENFTIKNPLGKSKNSELKYVTDGLIFLDSSEVQIRSSSVTLRRMASHLSGKWLPTSSYGFCLSLWPISNQHVSHCEFNYMALSLLSLNKAISPLLTAKGSAKHMNKLLPQPYNSHSLLRCLWACWTAWPQYEVIYLAACDYCQSYCINALPAKLVITSSYLLSTWSVSFLIILQHLFLTHYWDL